MKIILVISVVLIAIFGVGFIVTNGSDDDQNNNTVNNESSNDFAQIENEINEGSAYLFDVRSVEEFDAGHIEGAQNFPLQSLQSGSYPDIPSDSKIYVYCRSGSRSTVAKAILDKANYGEVVNLGAITSVAEMGGTTVN